MIIDPSKFEHVYRQLLFITRSRYPDTEPSFTSGFWDAEEGYKRDFWEKARTSLELDSWPDHRNDSLYIISKATQPFGVQMVDSSQLQNLVSYENYSKLFEVFSAYPRESAAAIYDVFFDTDEEAAFNQLAKLLSKKSMNDSLSIASLFFFLRDKDRFVTARKQGTGERLERLGLNSSCVQKCTWDGYQQYLAIIRELHALLLPLQPEAKLLDAQSFLWMLWMIQADTPEFVDRKPRVLFCNIAWMEYYDHICFPDDKPRYGGSYVTNTGSAFESWNYHRYEDGYYGFVETKYTGGTAIQDKANQLHIEKIDDEATGDAVDHVTVFFCAHSDDADNTVVVGWYEDATVLRYRKQHADGHMYNITAKHAVLLPVILRKKVIPRARGGSFGFGQSNLRYPAGDMAKESVKDLLEYIEAFGGNNAVVEATDKAIAGLSNIKLEELAGSTTSTPAPSYTTITTLRKRNPYLPEMAKRRANGVCQLCGIRLDYTDSSGRPYLEAHHIIPLADDGADELRNMVALCPNCHRKMHIAGTDADIEKMRQVAAT